MLDITAVILCGGQGTRLRPVIGNFPKCLAPVAGRPFIRYIINHLIEQNISKVVLCTGYGVDQIQKEIFPGNYFASMGPGGCRGIWIEYSHEAEPLGTGGALKKALPLLNSDPVLVLNGDTFCKFDLDWLVDRYERSKKNILAFLLYSAIGGGLYKHSGITIASREYIQQIPANNWEQHEGPALLTDEPFIDIGTPEGYAKAEDFLREQGVIT